MPLLISRSVSENSKMGTMPAALFEEGPDRIQTVACRPQKAARRNQAGGQISAADF